MKVGERHFRTIWPAADGRAVELIDQRWLPHEFRVETVDSVAGIATAIRDMWVRGAPLIGVTAAYGVAIQMEDDPSDAALDAVWETLHEEGKITFSYPAFCRYVKRLVISRRLEKRRDTPVGKRGTRQLERVDKNSTTGLPSFTFNSTPKKEDLI